MKIKETERVKKCVHELLSKQKLAALATQSPNGPYVNLVAFAADPALTFLLFATPRATRKFVNISAERRIAMLIDNSQNRETDFHQAMALTATGLAWELKGSERETFAKSYLSKHPYLETFVRSETCALMKLITETYYLVENFQHVSELNMRQ